MSAHRGRELPPRAALSRVRRSKIFSLEEREAQLQRDLNKVGLVVNGLVSHLATHPIRPPPPSPHGMDVERIVAYSRRASPRRRAAPRPSPQGIHIVAEYGHLSSD